MKEAKETVKVDSSEGIDQAMEDAVKEVQECKDALKAEVQDGLRRFAKGDVQADTDTVEKVGLQRKSIAQLVKDQKKTCVQACSFSHALGRTANHIDCA